MKILKNINQSSKGSIMKKQLLLTIGVLLLGTSLMAQTTVFSDDFTDNNRNGWYIFGGGAGEVDPIVRSLDASGGNMETVSTTNYDEWGAVANFNTVTLADGDYIQMSMSYTVIDNIGGDTTTFGLYSSGGTTITADQSGYTNVSDEKGYNSWIRSTEMRLVGDNGDGLGLPNGTDSMAKVTYTDPLTNPFSLIGSYTYSLKIENVSGQAHVTQIFNEGEANELSMFDSGSAVDIFTFDTVAFQVIRNDISVDDILITTTGVVVPEPSSIVLAALFVLAGFLGLRRRRG